MYVYNYTLNNQGSFKEKLRRSDSYTYITYVCIRKFLRKIKKLLCELKIKY